MKNKKYLVVILLLVLCLVGCKKNKDTEPENQLPEDTIAFLEAVEEIEFSLDCKDQLEVCFELYEKLGENSWNYDEVLDAFNMLVKFELLIKDLEAANHFISLVEDIPYVVTLDDKTKIDAAEFTYGLLTDTAKEFLDVDLAYENLLSAKASYLELEKADNEIKDSIALAEFNALVKQIPALNIFTLEDIIYVEAAEEYYSTMSESSKLLQNVIDAYKVVTDARTRYENMQNDPSIIEAILIEKFITLVNNLPSVDEITLDSVVDIEKAETAYRDLSSTSREDTQVVSANAILYTLRTKYNELLTEKEAQDREEALLKQINDFLVLVENLPSVDELQSSDGKMLSDARRAYDALPAATKAEVTIIACLEKIVVLEEKFATFNLQKIEFSFYDLISNGLSTPSVVLQGIELTFYSTLKSLYNVRTSQELAECVDFLFYIYHSSETSTQNYICYGDITNVLAAESNLVSYGVVINLLQEASKSDPTLESGSFKFGVQVVDKRNMYEDSEIFVGKGVIYYTFNNLYDDGTKPDGVIEISTKEEFLQIKDNLSGNYVLTADIDLENIEWENLGYFSGTLDGRGHKIYNMARTTGGDAVFGIFENILAGAKVSRIVLEGTVADGGAWAGAICVRNFGTIENCIINLDITSKGKFGYLAGISTDNDGIIKNCLVLSKISEEGYEWGTISANLVINNRGTISNCYASKDNSFTEKYVHAQEGSVISSGSYTNVDLKNSSLYSAWDTSIWNMVSGEYPTLIIE